MKERLQLGIPNKAPELTEEQTWEFFEKYKKAGEFSAVTRPSIESFHHVPEETKQGDQARVDEKRKKPFLRIQRETGPDAFAFENFLTTEISRNRWLGGQLSPTTPYDDWISGVDAVVEWLDVGGKPLRLAVDFTAFEQTSTLMKKSEKLESSVHIKYLRSRVEKEQDQPKELRDSMPIVLLGFDKEVYRFIANEKKPLSPEHPLRLLLLRQACSQIDLQLVLLVHKVFERPKATRNKRMSGLVEAYRALGEDFSVQVAADFMHTLDGDVRELLMSEKEQQRLSDLVRLKECLDGERHAAEQAITLDEGWQALAKSSRTHQMLAW